MPAVKSKKRAEKSSRSKSSDGFFAKVFGLFSHYTMAGAAGLTVIAAIAGFLLLSGGYVGLAAERTGRLVQSAAVAAGLDIRRVTALGLEQTSEQDMMGAVGPVVGASIAHFDIHQARARVEALGWVRSAAITRLWPNTVHVSIREREPAAVWQLSGELYLIDQNGAVIRAIDAYEFSNLPLIVGSGAPETVSPALQALRAQPALWGKASALVRVGERRWNLRLKSGGDVKFPEDDIDQAIRTLGDLQAAYGILDRPLEYVDLRDPARLVYRERDEEEDQAIE